MCVSVKITNSYYIQCVCDCVSVTVHARVVMCFNYQLRSFQKLLFSESYSAYIHIIANYTTTRNSINSPSLPHTYTCTKQFITSHALMRHHTKKTLCHGLDQYNTSTTMYTLSFHAICMDYTMSDSNPVHQTLAVLLDSLQPQILTSAGKMHEADM